MHLGLQWIVSALEQLVVEEEIKKEEKRATPDFARDEWVLINKIVKDILDTLKTCSRDDNPINPQRKFPYAIIFRQSESWKTVESKLMDIINPDSVILRWMERWRKSISDLRGYQQKNLDAGICIWELKNKRISEGKDLDPIDCDKIKTWRKYRSNAADDINNALQTARIELINNLQDSHLRKNRVAREVVDFIKTHWIHLTVFSEWHEVPMDEKKLFVQVRQAKDHNPTLKNFVNLSTKGIFTVEEFPADIQRGTRVIALQNQCIGPITPPPSGRSSPVKFKREDFYDYQYVDQNPIQKLNFPTKSAIGDRLHKIVNFALEEVNRKLDEGEET